MEQLSLKLRLDHVIEVILCVLPHADRLSSPLDRICRGVHDTAGTPRALADLVLRPVMVLHDIADKARWSGLDGRQDLWQALLHACTALVHHRHDILNCLSLGLRLNMLDGPVFTPDWCVVKCVHDLAIFKHEGVLDARVAKEGWKHLVGGEGRVEPRPPARFQHGFLEGDLRGLLLLLLQSALDQGVSYLMPVTRMFYLDTCSG